MITISCCSIAFRNEPIESLLPKFAEIGFDAVLLNTAVAKADDPARMARAFGKAVTAGREAFEAGLMEPRDMAAPSTPVAGTPFFDLGKTS